MYPAAVLHDIVTHDTVAGSGSIAAPGGCTSPHKIVLVQGKMAAHVGNLVMCTGATAAGPAAPAHPPGAPPVTPKGGGSKLGKRRELEAEKEREKIAAKIAKKLTIQVLRGRKGRPSQVGEFSIDLDVVVVDPKTGKTAFYSYKHQFGLGGNISADIVLPDVGVLGSASELLGVALDSLELKFAIKGGDPVEFYVDPGTDVTDLEGGAQYEEGSILGFDDNEFRFGMSSDGRRYEVELDFESDASTQSQPRPKFQNIVSPFIPDELPKLFEAGSSFGEMKLVGQVDLGRDPPPPPPQPGIFPIVSGSSTVMIHGMPAARIMPSSDKAACGCSLGHPSMVDTRTVLIGG